MRFLGGDHGQREAEQDGGGGAGGGTHVSLARATAGGRRSIEIGAAVLIRG